MLVGPSVKKLNILGVANLSSDLSLLEAFAARCPIANLSETLSEVRQLCDLFLSADLECVLDPATRASRFPHLATSKILKLMDKFKDVGLFAQVPPHLAKIKKKQVEAVQKRLAKL